LRSLLVGIRNRNRVWIGSFNKCDIENCPQIGGMKPATCPEKAVFGTVWTEDNSQNGLQYAGRKDTGDWGQIPIRMEREFRGPGYRAGRKNYEQDNNPMENQV